MATTRTKHFLRVWFMRAHQDEDTVVEVPERSERPAMPRDAYSWQYFDRLSVIEDGEELIGKGRNYSPRYFIGREIHDYLPVLGAPVLETSQRHRFVRTERGRIFFLNPDDKVVSP